MQGRRGTVAYTQDAEGSTSIHCQEETPHRRRDIRLHVNAKDSDEENESWHAYTETWVFLIIQHIEFRTNKSQTH